MRGLIHVSVGLETTPEETRAVEELFAAARIGVIIDREIARFSIDSPWVMYLSAPLPWLASQLASTLGPQDPAEPWYGLKAFMNRLAGAYRARGGSVVLTEQETETMIALTPDLPDDAYAELLELDLEEVEGQRIRWDPDYDGWYGLSGNRCPRRET
jgi:hypothetical protein